MAVDHRRLLNGAAGLFVESAPWPCALAGLGYSLVSLEQTARNRRGDAVRTDVIASSRRLDHSVVLECKTGWLDEDQLLRYCGFVDEDWITGLYVKPVHGHGHRVDVVLVCLGENLSRVQEQLRRAGEDPAVLCFHADRVVLEQGRLREREAHQLLGSGVPLDRNQMPSDLIPFVDDSVDQDVAYTVARAILQLWNERRRTFNITAVCEASHPLWRHLSGDMQAGLSQRVRQLVRGAVAAHLTDTVHSVSSSKRSETWEFQPPGGGAAAVLLRTQKLQRQLADWTGQVERGWQPTLPGVQ